MPETPENRPESPRPGTKPTSSLLVLSILGIFVVGVFILWVLARPNPQPPSTPAPVPTPTVAATPLPKATRFVLFVPNDNALLSREIVHDTNTPAGAPYPQKAKRALELLFPKIEFVPKGVKLLAAPTKEKNGVVRVNLSKEFLKLDSQPETPVMLTLDAMAKTLGALDSKDGKTFDSAKMQVLVEGKTVQTLSQFSLDEPWEASETKPETPDARDAI